MKYVTDGKQVFHKYYIENGEIRNAKTKQKLKVWQDKYGCKFVFLYSDNGGRAKGKSYQKLIRETINNAFKPENHIDVFNYEDKYSFNPQNPYQVYSKKYCKMLKVSYNKDGYPFVQLWKDRKFKTYYLHRMVFQSINRITIPEGYQLHHINEERKDPQYQNLKLMKKEQHLKYHKGGLK